MKAERAVLRHQAMRMREEKAGRRSKILKVPFHRPAFDGRELAAVREVLESGWLTMGRKTFEFERKFARYIGAAHAVAVSSCTAALHLALEAIGLRSGDEVLVPTTTFTSTAQVVTCFGARPVLVDIEPQMMNLDPEDARRKVSARSRAIIPVHLGGHPCAMREIASLAAGFDLRVIEDAAHALPARYDGKRIGTLSEMTGFSFYATKTLTTGEGGMVTTSDEKLAERVRLMRLHGISHDAWKRSSAQGAWFYRVMAGGYKYNMTDIQAALGLVQLAKCDKLCALRRRIARRYSEAFSRVQSLETPTVSPTVEPSWHLYIVRLRLNQLKIDRDRMIELLGDRGIETSVHFIPLHLQPYYQETFGYREGDLPNAEREYRRSISLPIYPGMKEEEVEYVIETLVNLVHTYEK